MHAEVDVQGVADIHIEVAAARFRLTFGDVESATLDVEGSNADDWTLLRQGETLSIRSSEHKALKGLSAQAVLTLPESLNDGSAVLRLEIAACEFQGAGAFLAVEADVAASNFDLSSQTQQASIELAAGKARLQLRNAATVALKVAAGHLAAWLLGGAPSSLSVEVATGAADLIVPAVPYRLRSSAALGSFSSTVSESPSSPNVIDVDVTMGKVSIEAQVDPGPHL